MALVPEPVTGGNGAGPPFWNRWVTARRFISAAATAAGAAAVTVAEAEAVQESFSDPEEAEAEGSPGRLRVDRPHLELSLDSPRHGERHSEPDDSTAVVEPVRDIVLRA